MRKAKQTRKVRKVLRGVELYRRGVSAYLPDPVLESIKKDLREALNCPDLIVHYSFCESPGQIVNKVHYVTRATFRDYNWDRYLAEELFNFRNIRWWGAWKGEPVWGLQDAEREGEDVAGLESVSCLQSGFCPDCGLPLKVIKYDKRMGAAVCWSRPVDAVYLTIWNAEEIDGTGYYRIPYRDWSGYEFSPDQLMKLSRLEAKARTSPSIRYAWRVAGDRLLRRCEMDRLWADVLWGIEREGGKESKEDSASCLGA